MSQTIRFLVANNMLEGVELTPGQAEDEERERNKVVPLEAEASSGSAKLAAEDAITTETTTLPV